MVCSNCHNGLVEILASTRGSLLTRPQNYIKEVTCPKCGGSGSIANVGACGKKELGYKDRIISKQVEKLSA